MRLDRGASARCESERQSLSGLRRRPIAMLGSSTSATCSLSLLRSEHATAAATCDQVVLCSGLPFTDQPCHHRRGVGRHAQRRRRCRNRETFDRLPAQPTVTLREAIQPLTARGRTGIFPELEGLIVVHQEHRGHARMARKWLPLGWQPRREQPRACERSAASQRSRRVRRIGRMTL